jgi:hypothetical protein
MFDEEDRQAIVRAVLQAVELASANETHEPTPERLTAIMSKVYEAFGATVRDEVLRSDWTPIAQIHRESAAFDQTNETVWGEALDLFDRFVLASLQCAVEHNEANGQRATEEWAHDYEILIRLHARSCTTAREVAALCRAGFADGALARWRTMHECAVVARLFQRHGVALARRFVDHELVSNLKDVRLLRENADWLGIEPIGDEELEDLEKRRAEAVARYEPGFAKPYGWASTIAPGGTFQALEEAAGMKQFRPIYAYASALIHAGPALRSLG